MQLMYWRSKHELSVIDVSEHQRNINWEKVKSAGVVGAMIRTGYGIKDPNQIDKYFYNNLSGCQNIGMPYGFYHYSYAVDVAGAEQEADFCLELIAESNPQYPVAFDMEENSQAALGKAGMYRYGNRFLQQNPCSRLSTYAIYKPKLGNQLY